MCENILFIDFQSTYIKIFIYMTFTFAKIYYTIYTKLTQSTYNKTKKLNFSTTSQRDHSKIEGRTGRGINFGAKMVLFENK